MINFYVKYINAMVKSYAYSHMDGTKLRLDKEIISRKNESTVHKVEASTFSTKNYEFIIY